MNRTGVYIVAEGEDEPIPWDSGPPVEVGDLVEFIPAANRSCTDAFGETLARKITGEVVEVNRARRWYRVKYEVPGCIRYEVFKY